MPSDAMRVWREIEEARYAVWKDHGPDETDQAAAEVIERAIANAVGQERAKAEALAEALRLVSKRCGPRSQDGAIAAAALKAWEK